MHCMYCMLCIYVPMYAWRYVHMYMCTYVRVYVRVCMCTLHPYTLIPLQTCTIHSINSDTLLKLYWWYPKQLPSYIKHDMHKKVPMQMYKWYTQLKENLTLMHPSLHIYIYIYVWAENIIYIQRDRERERDESIDR